MGTFPIDRFEFINDRCWQMTRIERHTTQEVYRNLRTGETKLKTSHTTRKCLKFVIGWRGDTCQGD